MKLHRLFTEDINRQTIIDLASKVFDGFTVYSAKGYWKGTAEPSLVIETITDKTDLFYNLARDIKHANRQEAVLVEVIANHADFV
jgi:hypothetical protein